MAIETLKWSSFTEATQQKDNLVGSATAIADAAKNIKTKVDGVVGTEWIGEAAKAAQQLTDTLSNTATALSNAVNGGCAALAKAIQTSQETDCQTAATTTNLTNATADVNKPMADSRWAANT